MPRTTSPTIKRRRLPSGATQFFVRLNGAFHALGTDHAAAKLKLAKLLMNGGRRIEPAQVDVPYLIRDLIADYLEFAEGYYPKRDGTRETVSLRHAVLRELMPMFGELPAKDFGPVALERVRQAMIDAKRPRRRDRHGREIIPLDAEGNPIPPKPALSRITINDRIHRIRRMFKWGVRQEKVPAAVSHALDSLPGLKRGRSDARENDAVRAVSVAEIEAACAHLRPSLRAMVWIQFLTGMRPGELLRMTGAELDRSGKVWTYKPSEHKTNYLGRERVIPIGPKAQEHLRPYLKLDPKALIFTPELAESERRDAQRAARRSPVQPSQQRRAEQARRNPQRILTPGWTIDAYRRAIARACAAARIEVWSPNQLRHAAATWLRREAGLEAARVVLGHARAAVTEVYAEVDHKQAAELMGRLG